MQTYALMRGFAYYGSALRVRNASKAYVLHPRAPYFLIAEAFECVSGFPQIKSPTKQDQMCETAPTNYLAAHTAVAM